MGTGSLSWVYSGQGVALTATLTKLKKGYSYTSTPALHIHSPF